MGDKKDNFMCLMKEYCSLFTHNIVFKGSNRNKKTRLCVNNVKKIQIRSKKIILCV